MIAFTRIPNAYAPLGGELRYAVAADAARQLVIRLLRVADTPAANGSAAEDNRAGVSAGGVPDNASSGGVSSAEGEVLGTKRFVGVAEASFDAAPYLRRAVRFAPSSGGTGFCDAAGRTVRAVVEATAVGGETSEPVAATAQTVPAGDASGTVSAPVRTFLPCAAAVAAPALLTTMPRERLIAPGECEELTLLLDVPRTITVTAEGMPPAGTLPEAEGIPRAAAAGAAGTERRFVRTFASEGAGLALFRVDTRDFPGAGRITVDAGACGWIAYTLLPAPEGARRVAWRTAAGSLEHYTFPIERGSVVKVRKARACGSEGVAAAVTEAENRLQLESACEGREVLRALAELTASPQVWLVAGDRYTPVDVLTDEAAVPGPGMPGTCAVALRPARKTILPWN